MGHSEVLRSQLKDVKTELVSVQSQLETIAIQAVNHKASSDNEIVERETVIQKLEETEHELKILAYTERIAEKTLYQLHWENCLLKEENNTLIRVLAKIKK